MSGHRGIPEVETEYISLQPERAESPLFRGTTVASAPLSRGQTAWRHDPRLGAHGDFRAPLHLQCGPESYRPAGTRLRVCVPDLAVEAGQRYPGDGRDMRRVLPAHPDDEDAAALRASDGGRAG